MKKLSAKFLCVVLSLVVLLCALPVTVYADSTVKNAGTAEELASVCSEINQNGGTYTINLTGDIYNGSVDIKKENAVVTVNGNNHTIFNDRTAVYVSDGATVNLSGGSSTLTLQGSNEAHETPVGNDDPGLIDVLSGSTCTMSANVTLKNHKGNNYLGGGVTVQGGTFIMNGGTIENCGIDGGSVCYGGGVAVFAGGYFEMTGGKITNCYATTNYVETEPTLINSCTGIGGGVFVSGGSVFMMTGGTISNCTATNYGGGVAVVSYEANNRFDSKAIISNGTIIENKASGGAGVFASEILFAYADAIAMDATIGSTSGGETSLTPGAAQITTPSNPGLYISGGLMKNNQATGTYDKDLQRLNAYGMGGGVLIANIGTNTSHIYDAEISANTADIGAGVAVFHQKTQTHIDNCTITGNTAVRNGGGFAAIRNKDDGESTFGYSTIKNTTITGNKSGDRGAGVYYDEESKLYISGADNIQSNTFNGVLNNLNVLSVEKPVYVNGALTGSKIGLSDPRLWDDELSDIEAPDDGAAELLTNGYKANNPEVHPSEYFTSDHETWLVDRTEKSVTMDDDPTSKIHREYTVNRYPLEENIIPNAYAGNRGQFEIIKIQNDLTKISNNDDLKSAIFEELNNYFNNSKVQFTRDYTG